MKFQICIIVLLAAIAAMAQETASVSLALDTLAPKGIVFNGVVLDSSFAADEKLNVEILESGEALQTTVGTPFSVVLPEDTLWNVCVTNSDTAGAEKEKCYELKYIGAERQFSQALGEAFVDDASMDSVAPAGLQNDGSNAVSHDSASVMLKMVILERSDGIQNSPLRIHLTVPKRMSMSLRSSQKVTIPA